MSSALQSEMDSFNNALLEEDTEQLHELAPDLFRKRDVPDEESKTGLNELLFRYIELLAEDKEFEEIQHLASFLKKEHPALYNSCNIQINTVLIQYYCYRHASSKKLSPLFLDIWSLKEETDLSVIANTFFYLAYYEYDDVIEGVVEELYQAFHEERYPRGMDIANWHISQLFNAHYAENSSMTPEEFREIIEEIRGLFGLKLNEPIFQQLKLAHTKKGLKSKDQWEKLFNNSQYEAFSFVKNDAQIKLFQMGLPFYISHLIWQELRNYYYNFPERSTEPFFMIEAESFVRFLQRQLVKDVRAIVIWGLPHVINYLQKEGFIEIYHRKLLLEFGEKLKTAFIHRNRFDLWQYSYVFEWQDGDHQAERELFDKSFELSDEEIARGAIGDPEQGIWGNPYQKAINTKRVKRKIKRNEKISVKYYDGEVKSKIKYKHVMQDIESGKCDIIDE